MTATVQTVPSSATNDPSLRLGAGLDRFAYFALQGFVAAIPWEGSTVFGGITPDRGFALAAFGVLFLRISATGRTRRLADAHYWMLAFVAWVAASLIWTVSWESTVQRVGTFAQLLGASWLIWEIVVTESRVIGLLEAYVFGIFLCSAATLYNFARGITAAQLASSSNPWDEQRFTITGMNANDLGLMFALSIPMTLYLITNQKSRFWSLFGWVHFVFCVTATFLTGSRGALVAAGAGCLMLPMTIRFMTRRQIALCGFVIGIAGVVAALLVPSQTWSRLMQFGTQLTQGTLTHRTVLWSAGWQIFREHPFLGVGSGGYGVSILRAVDIAFPAHNTFLSILVELGTVGALIFSGVFFNVLWCMSRLKGLERRLWAVTFFTWAVGVSALTFEYRKLTWFLFAAALAHAHSVRLTHRRVLTGSIEQVPDPAPSRYRWTQAARFR